MPSFPALLEQLKFEFKIYKNASSSVISICIIQSISVPNSIVLDLIVYSSDPNKHTYTQRARERLIFITFREHKF